MEVKRVRTTNRKQFELLVVSMEQNPSIAKRLKYCEAIHMGKDSFLDTWKNLGMRLNSLGPPTRSVPEWQKVWLDYKTTIKKKLAHNKKKSEATGGGPNRMITLSASEEAVVNLLKLDKSVDHSAKGIATFGISLATIVVPVCMCPATIIILFGTSFTTISNRHRFLHLSTNFYVVLRTPIWRWISTWKMLKTLIPPTATINELGISERKNKTIQKWKCFKSRLVFLKQMAEDSKETARYTRKMFKLKEEPYRKKQEYMLQQQKHRCEELQFKMQLLEYKKRKLDLLERNL